MRTGCPGLSAPLSAPLGGTRTRALSAHPSPRIYCLPDTLSALSADTVRRPIRTVGARPFRGADVSGVSGYLETPRLESPQTSFADPQQARREENAHVGSF